LLQRYNYIIILLQRFKDFWEEFKNQFCLPVNSLNLFHGEGKWTKIPKKVGNYFLTLFNVLEY